MTICKAFLRPLIDYGDVMYNQPQNEFILKKNRSLQYIPALAITATIKSTSIDKIYQEL